MCENLIFSCGTTIARITLLKECASFSRLDVDIEELQLVTSMLKINISEHNDRNDNDLTPARGVTNRKRYRALHVYRVLHSTQINFYSLSENNFFMSRNLLACCDTSTTTLLIKIT